MSLNSNPALAGLEVEDGSLEYAKIKKKIDRHLIPWFFSLGICCYLDRTNLSFAAVQLSRELGLSCATYGLGAGLFFLGYSFQVPSNMMLAKFGAPKWLSFIVIVWGLVAISFAATNGTAMFLILRVLLGLAECGTFPGIWAHLNSFYTARELGAAYSKVTTSTALAQVIGAPLAALILSFDGALGLAGWQWLFIIEGVTTLVFGVFLGLFLAPSPAKAKCLLPAEREWLQRRQDAQPTASKDTSMTATLTAAREVLRNWRVWYMSGLWLTITNSMYGIIFFAPMMIHQMFSSTSNTTSVESEVSLLSPSGAPPPSMGTGGGGGCSGEGGKGGESSGAGVALLSMAPFAAAAAAMLINARLAEMANERHKHAGVPIVTGAIFMALTPISFAYIAPIAAFLCLVLAAAFVWAFHAPFMSWPAVFLQGHEASTGFAVINSIGSLGGFMGPLLLGVLADKSGDAAAGGGGGSYGLAMFVLAGMLCIGGIGILLFPDGSKGKSLDQIGGGGDAGGLGGAGEVDGEEESVAGSSKFKDIERVPILGGSGGHSHL